MKKILRKIELNKKANETNPLAKTIRNENFIVFYKNGITKYRVTRSQLYQLLCNEDKENPIIYIFDLADRIEVDRDISISGVE